jgi:hypothetical protein
MLELLLNRNTTPAPAPGGHSACAWPASAAGREIPTGRRPEGGVDCGPACALQEAADPSELLVACLRRDKNATVRSHQQLRRDLRPTTLSFGTIAPGSLVRAPKKQGSVYELHAFLLVYAPELIDSHRILRKVEICIGGARAFITGKPPNSRLYLPRAPS